MTLHNRTLHNVLQIRVCVCVCVCVCVLCAQVLEACVLLRCVTRACLRCGSTTSYDCVLCVTEGWGRVGAMCVLCLSYTHTNIHTQTLQCEAG